MHYRLALTTLCCCSLGITSIGVGSQGAGQQTAGASGSKTNGSDPPAIPKSNLSESARCKVTRVLGSSSIEVEWKGGSFVVELMGISSLPSGASGSGTAGSAAIATTSEEFLSTLVTGEEVFLDWPGRRDGSPPAKSVHVYRVPDGLWVNLEMVRQGFSRATSVSSTRDHAVFLGYERRARTAQKGLWKVALTPAEPSQPPPAPIPSTPMPPSADPAPADSDGQAALLVYVTRSGKKYHRADCSYAKSGASPLELKVAKTKYTPCSRCSPP